jgi:membrane protein
MALLLWIYYSAQIFLLGAEFTRAWVGEDHPPPRSTRLT